MIDVTQDIHSLTTFKRNSSGLMKKTGRPLVLTVKGKAEAVVLDAKAYQEVANQLGAVAMPKPAKARVVRQVKCWKNWNTRIFDSKAYNRS